MLDGEWAMISMEQRGQKSPDEAVRRYRLTISGNQWTVTTPRGAEPKLTFQTDPSQDPKTIDLTLQSGDRQAVSRGIFKLEGDTLTICRTTGDTERPTEFKTKPESGVLVVWQRVKK
jgi:uncharacterized protein (TIGR03067 family)